MLFTRRRRLSYRLTPRASNPRLRTTLGAGERSAEVPTTTGGSSHVSILKRRVFGLAFIAALVIGVPIAIAATAVSGAGSTLAAPVYQQWGADLKAKLQLQYNPSGSGAGIA